MLSTIPHHIIAIGASAGGMQEINEFFDHTPLDGVSYVIIQHQSPDFKSFMKDLLSKHSKLLVKLGEEGMEIVTNEVYLVPNDKFMTVEQGRLHLSDKLIAKSPHLTIDQFLISLAQDSGSKAIAVILSGMGNDGTQGIKAIKKAGGMVIARNPDNSTFKSMPSQAILTGLVDFILEPDKMPEAIEDYVQFGIPYFPEDHNDAKDLEVILGLIKNETNLDFSDYKTSTLLRRVKKRISQLDLNSTSTYIEYLKSNSPEPELLSKDFLISFTSFFRDVAAFEFLENQVIPPLIDSLGIEEELKLWITGCATGEEVYSLAILFWEGLEKKNRPVTFKIFATDIDASALLFAGKGVYSKNIIPRVPQSRLDKFFIREEASYRVKPELRKLIIFARHDLVKNPPYCNMHFISCRNIIIYMTPALQKKIFARLHFGLKKGGYLFLGSSENPMPILKNLEIISQKFKIYKNLLANRLINFDSFALPEFLNLKSFNRVSGSDSLKNDDFVTQILYENLINDCELLSLCIDENKNVIKSYGDTSQFLLQKNFTVYLPDLLPQILSMAFSTLSMEANQTQKKAALRGIKLNHNGINISVKISVFPIIINSIGSWQQVTFTKESIKKSTSIPIYKNAYIASTYTLNLEREVLDLKERVKVMSDQLDSSNENLQSYNEELLSANEEMQSSNEEMQSVNEELDTINSSFQHKNKELQELNDDLNNYFRSSIHGQLFINNDLELIRFSPICSVLVNVRESDIGRPIHHISNNFKSEILLETIKRVIKDGISIEQEMETINGSWFQIITMPYIQSSDGKSKGVIITFMDISLLKSYQFDIEKKNRALTRINADLDNFVITASHDLLAPLSNIEMSINIMHSLEIKDPELTRFLDIIYESSKKFRRLIKDMAIIAKLESESSNVESLQLSEIIQNIEWSLASKIEESKAVLKMDLAVEDILFSKKNLRSILFNIISNAIKFRREEFPVILIRSYLEEEFVVISVKDNGTGMDERAFKKIFDIYGRLQQDVDGIGIGLYLAQKIVNSTGGRIKVESELGIGSNFSVYLRRVPETKI